MGAMWSCELTGRCYEVFYMFLPLQGLSSTDPRRPFGYPEHVILVAPQSVYKLIPGYGSIVIFLTPLELRFLPSADYCQILTGGCAQKGPNRASQSDSDHTDATQILRDNTDRALFGRRRGELSV